MSVGNMILIFKLMKRNCLIITDKNYYIHRAQLDSDMYDSIFLEKEDD